METIQLCLFTTKAIFVCLALYLAHLARSYSKQSPSPSAKYLLWLLCIIALCNANGDVTWLLGCARRMQWFQSENLIRVSYLYKRLAWLIGTVQYFLFVLFLENIVRNLAHKRLRRALIVIPLVIFTVLLLYISIAYFYVIDPAQRVLERLVYGYIHYYTLGLMWYMIGTALIAIWQGALPRILRAQVRTITFYFLIPHLAFMLIATSFSSIVSMNGYSSAEYLLIILNDLVFVGAFYLCIRRMLNLRFLGIHEFIQRKKRSHFVEVFQDLFIELSKARTMDALIDITKRIFSPAFDISREQVELHIRPRHIVTMDDALYTPYPVLPTVELFLNTDKSRPALNQIHKLRILIRDELEFDQFYDSEQRQQELITFLDQIDADIFLPVYEDSHIIGYVIIAQNARPHLLFSSTERAEMLMYANHLSGLIYCLQHRNLRELMLQEKQMREELFRQQREIQHCNESLRALALPEEQPIGIGNYHRRKFIWMNSPFKRLLEFEDITYLPRHLPSLRDLCEDVIRYGNERSVTIKTDKGIFVHCTAMPYTKHVQVLLLVHQANAVQSASVPLAQYRDHAAWEYLLYLETTESGRIIRKIIPGTTPTMITFKIELMKAALSRKALLVEATMEDGATLVNILHHISLRSTLHTLTIVAPERAQEGALALFGITRAIDTDAPEGLCSSLNAVGTLCIENVDYLSMATQARLAELITTGMYRKLMSERMSQSDVRIICTTITPLATLIRERKICPELHAALERATIAMPSIMNLPRHELVQLAHQICEQTVQNETMRPLMALTQHELETVVNRQPQSLHELREHVRTIVEVKSERKQVTHIVKADHTPHDVPPDLMDIVRLGKAALKDREMMLLLWNRFKSQVKIANLLGVNRSTVNRRLKQFNIGIDESRERLPRVSASSSIKPGVRRMRATSQRTRTTTSSSQQTPLQGA